MRGALIAALPRALVEGLHTLTATLTPRARQNAWLPGRVWFASNAESGSMRKGRQLASVARHVDRRRGAQAESRSFSA